MIDAKEQLDGATAPEQNKLSDEIVAQLIAAARREFSTTDTRAIPRGEKARLMGELVSSQLAEHKVRLNALDLRNVVRLLIDEIAKPDAQPLLRETPQAMDDILAPRGEPASPSIDLRTADHPSIDRRVERPNGATPDRVADRVASDRVASDRMQPKQDAKSTSARQAKTERRGDLLDESGTGQLFYSVHAQPGGSGAVDHKATEMARDRIHPVIMERIDVANATRLPRHELERQLTELVGRI